MSFPGPGQSPNNNGGGNNPFTNPFSRNNDGKRREGGYRPRSNKNEGGNA